MSFLKKFFKRKEGSDEPSPGAAIDKLRDTQDMLVKKQVLHLHPRSYIVDSSL